MHCFKLWKGTKEKGYSNKPTTTYNENILKVYGNYIYDGRKFDLSLNYFCSK